MPQILMLIAALLLAQTPPAPPKAVTPPEMTTWQWYRAVAGGAGWFITQGKATVAVAGSDFSAELRDVEYESLVRVTLMGSIVRGSVSARATIQHSDVGASTVRGRVRRFCWPDGGREILVLTDDVDVISLFRDLPKGEPCKATQ